MNDRQRHIPRGAPTYKSVIRVLRLLAKCRYSSFPTEEIAKDLACSGRTVNRYLEAMRKAAEEDPAVAVLLEQFKLPTEDPLRLTAAELKRARKLPNNKNSGWYQVAGKKTAPCNECRGSTTSQVRIGDYQIFLCARCRRAMEGSGLL